MDKPILRALAASVAAGAVAFVAAATVGQPTSDSPLAPPPNSVRRVEPAGGWHALVGATVHVSPKQVVERATVVIRDGRIVTVEAGGAAPAGAQAHDASRLHIYAGFIEPYLEVEVPRPDASAPGSHWNPRITPQRGALDRGSRGIDERTGQTLRELGFTAAAISPKGGIFRGRSAVVSLARPSGDPSAVAPRVYRDAPYQAMSFETSFVEGVTDQRTEITPDEVRWSSYPNSQMGAIALIRQTLSDADWQGAERMAGRFNGPSNALDWLIPPQTAGVAAGATSSTGGSVAQVWGGLLLFDAGDELEALRATKIGREYSRPVAVLGSGREYRRLEALVQDNVALILPLNFPRPPQVETIGEANAAELDDLIHWEQAPTNPRRVDAALRAISAAGGGSSAREADVSLTTSKGQPGRAVRGRRGGGGGAGAPAAGGGAGADGRDSFGERLSTAIKHGLAPERALAMLTVNPAKLLGVESILGTVEAGKIANLVVADGPLFMDRPDPPRRGEAGYRRPARIVEVWTDGVRNEVRARPEIDISGKYEVAFTPPLPGDIKVTLNFAADEPGDEPELTITKTVVGAQAPVQPGPDDRPRGGRRGRDGAAGAGDAGGDGSTDIRVRTFERSGPGLSRFTFSFDHEPFGEKGVFLNSGVIDREADGTVVLRGDYVRSSGARMAWVARRVGAAAPRKPSLTGAWPLVGEAGGTGAPVLVFDRGNVLTVQLPPGVRGREDGRSATVDDFEYDGRTISYSFDSAQMGAPGVEGIWRSEATIDWSAHPPRMSGTTTSAAGEKSRWTATRRERNPFSGEWRVTQLGGRAMPDDGSRGLIIRITGPRDRPVVKLLVTEAGKRPTDIEADEESLRIGKLFFTYATAKLGGAAEGRSSDEITINWSADGPEGDVLVGLARRPGAGGGAGGEAVPYEARRTRESLDSEHRERAAIAAIPESLGLPVGGYALREPVPPDRVMITGATIWTCRDGTTDTALENGAVVISDGKIQYVGPSAGVPRLAEGFSTIDATGKFVAPGIVDCHSHTGISRGVNESGQAVTAEVRIGDVTDPDNVSWYRQLAGGVTSVNNLHGSANAIGGQNQVNKIRWGCVRPDDMHFEGAIAGIKFALGENPKQSNWGDRNTTRYPQTRMGVEMLIRDRFTAAREYLEASKSGRPPRRDLELEALAEIIDGRRLVHCHSYRQDEILMLCRVAREFGFRIGTFQHILEGYKVADELVKWSGGGSAFSDWWAYKWEVFDAIPAAGPLMAEQGVIVSFNSDSDEMARRMNVEAGKAAKYSGKHGGKPIPPHEAFKFVTLNPAKQLRIEQRTGSLEAGKDADLAIWSGVPTSPTSRCEMTWVDGRRLFSLEQDAEHRRRIASERSRLVQKVLAAGGRPGGGRSRSEGEDDDPPVPGAGPVGAWSDQDMEDESMARTGLADVRIDLTEARRAGRRLMLLDAMQTAADRRREWYMNTLLRGLDPRWMRAGDCGCEMTGGEQ